MLHILSSDDAGIAEAARILDAGGLVGFPTETVYGLGADGLSQSAVERIFEAKGRPPDNPLILHVDSVAMVSQITKAISDEAKLLMSRFWPGPLTLVLERGDIVPPIVSAGLDTIAVRMPRHPIALALIRALGRPIAAPSANISGRPSPTKAAHVSNALGDKIDALIDGGDCIVGLESTVVDAISSPGRTGSSGVRILRPGAVTAADLAAVLGYTPALAVDSANGKERSSSPGTRHAHYQPRCRVRLYSSTLFPEVDMRDGIVALTSAPPPCRMAVRVTSLEEYARKLYDFFHQADALDVDRLFLEIPPDHGIGRAIIDRITRAAANDRKTNAKLKT